MCVSLHRLSITQVSGWVATQNQRQFSHARTPSKNSTQNKAKHKASTHNFNFIQHPHHRPQYVCVCVCVCVCVLVCTFPLTYIFKVALHEGESNVTGGSTGVFWVNVLLVAGGKPLRFVAPAPVTQHCKKQPITNNISIRTLDLANHKRLAYLKPGLSQSQTTSITNTNN